jgi:hypothetical protein
MNFMNTLDINLEEAMQVQNSFTRVLQMCLKMYWRDYAKYYCVFFIYFREEFTFSYR